MKCLSLLSLLFLSLLPYSHTACTASQGCYPPTQNISPQLSPLSLSVSSTCGQEGPELSCLINLSPGGLTQCYNCTATEHAASRAVDGNSDTWWQAQNDLSDVTLRLNLSAPFLLSETTLLWHSPRPRSMLLEFSTDYGATWSVYQFFSPDCEVDFNMSPSPDPTDPSLGTAPVCDVTQSDINPLSGGTVSFSPAARVPGGLTNTSSSALNYLLVTDLRARVLSFNRAVGVIDEGYFHAVSEWIVSASCSCNGHADSCDAARPSQCVCGHNTEGDSCERCLPLFNNREYLPGTVTESNSCQLCQCNSHASSCLYDSGIGAGVCQDCRHNTTGDNCQSCLPFFYRDPLLLLTDSAICRPCVCNAEGTADAGECRVSTGECTCKSNVFGRDCSQCKIGFFNLSSQIEGCRPCGCMDAGSLAITCHSETGQCSCRDNVEGTQCDTCKDGFYGLSGGGACVPCGCDAGGAASSVCDKLTGNCECLPHITGSKCNRTETGHFLPGPEHLLFEGEEGNIPRTDVPGYEGLFVQLPYTGSGLVRVERGETLELRLSVPRLFGYIPVLRYFTLQTGSVNIEIGLVDNLERCENHNRIQTAVLNSSYSSAVFLPTCLQEAPTLYSISITPTDTGMWLDSLLLVPDYSLSPLFSDLAPQQQDEVMECIKSFYSIGTAVNTCEDTLFSLLASFYLSAVPCDCHPLGSSFSLCTSFGGQCPCREGVRNRDCTMCTPGYHSMSATGCAACGCDPAGAINKPCNVTTGQCACKTGVTALTCDSCQAGFYSLSASGCDACLCSAFSADVVCNSSGQCSCLSGVTGDKCTSCSPGYFSLSVGGCRPCGCSEGTSDSIECSEQGACSCINRFSGDKCGICEEGNYVAPQDGVPVCKECKCYTQADTCANLTQEYSLSRLISNFSSCQAFLDASTSGCTMGWLVEGAFYLQLLVNRYITFLVTSPVQVYWLAPRDFLGDRGLSYGQNIVLSIFSEDLLDEERYVGPEPDIIIQGSFLADQLVSSFPSEVSSGPGNPFSIPLIETSWRVGTPEGPVATYAQLIQVLSNLTSLRIRARYSEASIASASMEYFVIQTLVADPGAGGQVVERCECPNAYSGHFCEACATGFFRPSLNPTHSCSACDCNGHTDTCDSGTGLCVACQNETTGDHCDTCINGFYGDATGGTPSDCLPCPCPLVTQSFSPTCTLGTDGLPTCDSCASGYTGRTCQVCEDGYFGTPTLPGSRCTTCSCSDNIDLSQTGNCNRTTGECVRCLNNSAGFECELCAPGYFGDALADSCAPCQCNGLGREDNLCQSDSGVCSCKPHVLGEQCGRCEAGYWGLHLGLPEGCVSCDCCLNGSVSHTCNTTSGVCSCNANIGGERDIKCCACSLDAFNFKDTGCELCGCDSGAVDESCDQVTGVCRCDVGVQGDKCDVCSFGYTGSPPSCEQCPQCFYDWLFSIQLEDTAVQELGARADTLLSSYLPLTISNISSQINRLSAQLLEAASLVQSSTLDQTQLSRLDSVLAVLSHNLTALHQLLGEISTSLRESEGNIQTSTQFNGTIQLGTGEVINAVVLLSDLTSVRDSIERARETASNARRSIATENINIYIAQASIDTSRERIGVYTNTSRHLLDQLTAIESTVFSFNSEYDRNRMSLSSLGQMEERIAMQQNGSRALISEGTSIAVPTDNATREGLELSREKEGRAAGSLHSIGVLLSNAESTANQSDSALSASLAVLNISRGTADLSNLTQNSQTETLARLDSLQQSGDDTGELARDSLSLIGPDPAIANLLTDNINRLVVSEEVVESIREEASRSLVEATVAGEIAIRARQAANNASNLLIEVVNNTHLTQLTQTVTTNVSIENARNALMSAAAAVGEFYRDTEELVETSDRIISLGGDVGQINREFNNKYSESIQSATVAERGCGGACEQGTSVLNQIQFSINDVDSLSGFLTQKDTFVSDAVERLNSLVSTTNFLLEELTSVDLIELQTLLEQLASEQQEIDSMLMQAEQLEGHMALVEENISTLVQLYETCPQ